MKNRFLTMSLVAIVAVLTSCSAEEELVVETVVPLGQKMIFDENGYNPYVPDMMQLAFDSMKAKVYETFPGARAATEAITIDFSPNKKYVRFLPTDSLEFDTLMSLEDLALFNYPLDLPIVQQGEYEAEPANEAGFHWLYGVVPIDFEFEPVALETIDEVFMPVYPDIKYDDDAGRLANDSTEIYGMLMATELYSMYLAGHLSDEEADELLAVLEGEESSGGRSSNSGYDTFIDALKSVRNTIGSMFITPAYGKKINPLNWCWGCIFGSGWTPNGKMLFKYDDGDTGIKTKPLIGLKVVMHRGLKSVVAYTDHNGNFESYRKFGSRVTYTAHFRNRSTNAFGTRYFRIVRGDFWMTHKHDFKNATREDNITYTYNLTDHEERVDNLHELAACIYMAGRQFYHDGVKGFKRPRTNMRIRIYNTSGRPVHAGVYFFTTNQIKMYINDSRGNRKTASGAMATAFHELGHASHFNLDGCCYHNNAFHEDGPNNEDLVLKESWAMYVEHHLNRIFFPSYNGDLSQDLTFSRMNKGFPEAGREGKYTSLFFDLVDTNDQSQDGSKNDRPRDKVHGYTTIQIQEALRGTSSLQELHDKLYDGNYNSSEQHLQALIDSYSDNLKPIR